MHFVFCTLGYNFWFLKDVILLIITSFPLLFNHTPSFWSFRLFFDRDKHLLWGCNTVSLNTLEGILPF